MKKILFLFTLWVGFLYPHSIVFIHIGNQLPSYLPIALEQARLFNPDCDIYLLCNSIAARSILQKLKEKRVTRISLDSLRQSADHQRFLRQTKLCRRSLNGFWLYTSERFFYLEEFIRQQGLFDVFHLENDVMLYADLGQFLPILHTHYSKKMGVTFEYVERVVPGFIYISEIEPLSEFTRYFSDMKREGALGDTDMDALGRFQTGCGERYIAGLPVLLPQYYEHRPLQRTVQDISLYSAHFEQFDSIFDAASIGQYLGGVSPINVNPPVPGYVNPLSCFDVSFFDFTWERDEQGRNVPFLLFEGEKKRINNLHIHCKELWKFSS